MTNSDKNKRLWLGALALLLAGAFALGNVASWPVKLRYPGEENLAEGVQLVEMLHLRQGVPIYDPPSATKFDTPVYGPLYYWLGSRLINPAQPAYLPVRLLSLAGLAGCVLGCALLAFWLSRKALAAVLAALLFLSYRFVTLYGASDRCDVVALLLCFAGFLVAYRLRNSGRLLWSVPLILAGLFYKQQFVAAPLAILLYLAISKRFRLALEFAALLAGGGLALACFFQFVVFRGQAFLTYFAVYARAVPFSLHRFGLGAFVFAVFFVFPIVVAIEFLRTHRDRLLACYLGLALPLSVLLFAREGSDANYFVECALLLSPLFAALIAERTGDLLRTAELLFFLIVTLIPSHRFAEDPPRGRDFVLDQAIQKLLSQRFPAHSAALGYYGGDLTRSSLDVPISDLFAFSRLVRRGFFSDQGVIDQLRDHRFQLVVVGFDLEKESSQAWLDYYLTAGIRETILTEYQPWQNLEMPEPEKFRATDRFYLWIPRHTATPSAPAK